MPTTPNTPSRDPGGEPLQERGPCMHVPMPVVRRGAPGGWIGNEEWASDDDMPQT